jgi:hypothetical protein
MERTAPTFNIAILLEGVVVLECAQKRQVVGIKSVLPFPDRSIGTCNLFSL